MSKYRDNGRHCQICGQRRGRGGCTNRRCAECHAKHCAAGGNDSPGHGATYRDNGNGTCWVAPGEGATVDALESAVFNSDQRRRARLNRAESNLGRHTAAFDRYGTTNLALTGEPLTALDLDRIASDNLEVE